MSRVRNATEFLSRLRRTRANYQDRYRSIIAEVRAQYSNNPSGEIPPEIDESLEHHLREYFINGFLYALNWRLELSADQGLPNLVPEAPIASLARGSTRFLDYLGADRETGRPLLVVETKRPSSHLPRPRTGPASEVGNTSAIICNRLVDSNQADLGADWNEWLDTLKDYVRSLQGRSGHIPRRVAITNGRWLVLFVDPADSFLSQGRCSPENVLIFKDSDNDSEPPEIEQRFEEIYSLLEHQHLLDNAEPLEASQLPFHINPALVDVMTHALHVKYIEQEGIYQVSPVIEVSPIVFVRSRFGAWLRVESRQTDFIPHKSDDLIGHLERIDQLATRLLRDVNEALRSSHPARSVEEHYDDTEGFEDLPGVIERRHAEGLHTSQEMIVITGSKSHYLLAEPTSPNCPYHDWAQSRGDGCEFGSPIEVRTTDPRSFFKSRELHHCSHRLVAAAKAGEITAENRIRCGSRSGRNGEAFCEVWRLDEYLCCRTCVFQNVCTKAEIFTLPCRLPEADLRTH